MAILDQKELIKKQLAQEISSKIVQMLTQLQNTLTSIFSTIWNPGNGLVPQDIFDAFGTDAHELFELALICIQTINAAKGTNVPPPPPPYAFTINPDGTVTVGDPVTP